MKKSVFAKSCIILMTMIVFFAGCQTTGLLETVKTAGTTAVEILKPGTISGNFKVDAARYTKLLAIGTYNLLQALSNMHEAVGNKELAEQILLQANDLKNKSDKGAATDEDYKKAFKTIDESSIDREQLSKVPANKGRIYLTKSSINIGLGSASDGKALAIAISLVKHPPIKKNQQKSDIMVALKLVKLTYDTLPKHVQKACAWTAQLNQYMQDNDIKLPTKEEQRAEAEKQGASQEEIDDIFA